MLSKAMFIGHLGSDLKVHAFENGNRLGLVSLAVNESYTAADGTKVKKTTWVPLVVPNHLMEHAPKLLTMGKQVYVEARYQTHEYKDQAGEMVRAHEFRVLSYELLGSKAKEGDAAAGVEAASASAEEFEEIPA